MGGKQHGRVSGQRRVWLLPSDEQTGGKVAGSIPDFVLAGEVSDSVPHLRRETPDPSALRAHGKTARRETEGWTIKIWWARAGGEAWAREASQRR